jgi:hypothetical protein
MTPRGCTIVFYHYVRDVERTPFPGIKGLSVAGFEAQLDWLQARYDVVDGPAFEGAVLTGVGFDRPTALLTFDDGFVDHYEHVFPLLNSRGLGGIFFLAGGTLGENPVLLNVHKTHFLLSQLGADRFTTEVGAALEGEGVSTGRHESTVSGASHGREGIYRYDEAPDVRIKRILNYEAPYPVADRVLSRLFALHVGDAAAFAVKIQQKVMQHPKGEPPAKLELTAIVEAEQQVVAGMNYRLRLKVKVDGETLISAAEGNGPVNALDLALRKDLGKYQTYIKGLELTDYRVRILNGGTEAVTRVLIESQDETGERWTTVGVSPNIIDASFQALMDSIVYKLVRSHAPT